jgi:REP element-mobilizing transposase RayT
MQHTLGYHYVKSGFGLWLPGDDRGSWSEAWDDEIGFTEPHTLHSGDPVRLRMARERMQHAPVRFSPPMIDAIVVAIDKCDAASPWNIAAASIESTHLHLLITYSGLDIDRTVKWLAQQMTKEVHRSTAHQGPIFCEGNWCSFLFDKSYWQNTRRYIERHNERRGQSPKPYAFISDDVMI